MLKQVADQEENKAEIQNSEQKRTKKPERKPSMHTTEGKRNSGAELILRAMTQKHSRSERADAPESADCELWEADCGHSAQDTS